MTTTYTYHRVLGMRVEGVRARGRTKRHWSDSVGEDLKENNIENANTKGRREWGKEAWMSTPYEWDKTKIERFKEEDQVYTYVTTVYVK